MNNEKNNLESINFLNTWENSEHIWQTETLVKENQVKRAKPSGDDNQIPGNIFWWYNFGWQASTLARLSDDQEMKTWLEQIYRKSPDRKN